ncbi:MAG: deoxyribose-phosphate aldolase [Clostridia bacterium]|nr:deoxyribose-phosphate aldolase [Clostridia bacterium]
MNLNEYIDHTLLKPIATESDIKTLCEQAVKYSFKSVCVNPCDVAYCAELLKDTGVKVCTVIGFPLGKNNTAVKIYEAINAINNGATELDMVINVAKLKEGNVEYVKSEIEKVISISKGNVVKVIIESGLLTDSEIALATKLVCEAGADFVKTSTGITGGGATENAVKIMKANLFGKTKIKASGGIKTKQDALRYINLGASRIGTSSGVEIVK